MVNMEVGGGESPSTPIHHVDANVTNIDFQLDDLDDIEFDLPAVGTPPTLESILNQPDDESLSDEELLGQLPNNADDFIHGQNSQWNVDSPDTASVNSHDSSESAKTGNSCKRQKHSPKLFMKHGAIMKHVVLRGVTSQIVSATERVKAGKPSAMAVSNFIAIGTTHGIVLIFDVKQAMKWCLGNIEIGEQHGSVSALCFNADCSRILVGHAKGLISKWDLQSGKLLQNIVDVHPLGTAVLHMYFIDEHTRAIFSDSGGSVFELNFKKSINGRSCESQCIFSGSRGEVCILQPLITNPHHNHSLKPYDLLALATMSKVIVIALRPTIQVLFSHPLKADHTTLPLLCWQFVIIQMTNSTRIVDPVLTFGRENAIYFFQATESHPKSINFIPLQKMKLTYTILNFAWLNSRTFAIFDTNEVLHVIDVRSEEPLEAVDLSSVNMIYNSSHFKALSTGGNVSKAMALVGERACYESVKIYNGQLLILGTHSIHVMTIRTWSERINYLANRNKFKECLSLTQSFYEESAKAVVGLNGRRDERKKCVAAKMEELITRYADSIVTHLKPSDSSETNLEDYFRDCVPICVEFCFYLNRINLLFDVIYEKMSQHIIAKNVFFESLEPFILKNRLSIIPPLIAQEFVAHYKACELFQSLEACIVQLDITSLDIHQVMTLCWKHNLYDSILYIYNKGMLDFVTPLEDLIVILAKAVATGKQLSDENIRLGNKLFVYISCCLAGRGYPRGELDEDLIPNVQFDIFQVITASHSAKFSLKGEEVFPYLKTLLKFDTREFLNVLSMAFEESSFQSGLRSDDRQTIVDILLHIMVDSPDFTPSQVGALFTFLARQLAISDNGIIVDHMLFEQVLEYLTSVGDESRIEERQQALMDLYQAGGLSQINDKKLLMLAEKAHFYRMCESLYEKDRSFDKILGCYLRDPVRQSQVFTFIKQIASSTKYTAAEKKIVERETVNRIKDLVHIDNKKTAKIVINFYPQNLSDILVKLQDKPKVQYGFLGGVFEYHDANVKPIISQRSIDKEKEVDFQPAIEAEIHEKYIDLMCGYNPANVAQHVKNSDGYRLEETLYICRKHNILEAVSYLLEKTGDIKGAFKIMLKSVVDKIAEVENIIHNNTNKIINIEDKVEWGSFQTSLVVIIQLCQRNCPKMTEQEREALWFPLFEALTIPQRKLKDSLSSYLPVFKEVTRYLLNSMMGYIAVPSILEKIMKDPAYSSGKLGEIRDMIMGMLETYSYEQTLLHLTNNLLCGDLHKRLSTLHTIANKGYASHSNKCSICHKSFSSTGSQIIIFRCGHSFHITCIQDNEPNVKPIYGQVLWYCYLCKKPTKGKRITNANRSLEQPETDANSNSRTSQRASAYLQAANQQSVMKHTPTKTKVTLDHNQIQGLEYLRKLHKTNSRLAVLNELSKSDGDDVISSPQRVNRTNSSIFTSVDFSLRLTPSGEMSTLEEEF